MRTLSVAVVVVLGLTSCLSSAANEKYRRRVNEIDQQYQRDYEAIESAFATGWDRIKKLHRDAQIRTDKKNKTVPLTSVEDLPELAAIARECLTIAEGENEERVKECVQRWNETNVRMLVTTYWAADLDWILLQLKSDPQGLKIESLFVYSHNLRLSAYVEKQLAALNAARMSAHRELADERQLVVQQAAVDRDNEIAENRRRFAAAMAVAASAMANAQNGTGQQSAYPSNNYSSASSGCTSDYSCGIGHRCVKANYSGTGYCAKAVNEYGVQTFDLPDMNSVFVKMPSDSDCKFVTDCPIGFRCDTRSGTCLR